MIMQKSTWQQFFFFRRVNKQGMVQGLKEVETQKKKKRMEQGLKKKKKKKKKKNIQQNVILVHYKQKKSSSVFSNTLNF